MDPMTALVLLLLALGALAVLVAALSSGEERELESFVNEMILESWIGANSTPIIICNGDNSNSRIGFDRLLFARQTRLVASCF